jgi:hypothetical protein
MLSVNFYWLALIKGRLMVRTKKSFLAVVLAFSIFFSVIGILKAEENSYTCQKIVSDCESNNNKEYGSCLGYIAGMIGWEIFLQANMKKFEYRTFCFTEGTTMGKIKKTFIRYVSEHPEELNSAASLCFYNSIKAEFACNKK